VRWNRKYISLSPFHLYFTCLSVCSSAWHNSRTVKRIYTLSDIGQIYWICWRVKLFVKIGQQLRILHTGPACVLVHLERQSVTTSQSKYIYTYCHMQGVRVTNNNGFLIWWLVLLELLTITVNYDSSRIELLFNDVCLTNLYEESQTKPYYSRINEWTLFYNSHPSRIEVTISNR
jgi:hypothetical protein